MFFLRQLLIVNGLLHYLADVATGLLSNGADSPIRDLPAPIRRYDRDMVELARDPNYEKNVNQHNSAGRVARGHGRWPENVRSRY